MTRSEEVWALLAGRLNPGPAAFVREPRSVAPVTCWPLSQVIHAAAMIAPERVPPLFRGARAYRAGQGYRESPLRGKRYYDDNAWMALASLQHYRVTGNLRSLSRAQWIAGFLGEGTRDGGCRWVEGGDTVNACSTGAAALVACELGRDAGRSLRALAEMRRADGVVGDHLRADGTFDEAAFSYNQGLLIGLAARCGERRLLADAIDAGSAYYTPDRLWQQPVAFNAIYARGLVRAGAPLRRIADYADELWQRGRDGGGWFTAAGRYDDGKVLDTAAAAQLLAIVDGDAGVDAATVV